MTTGEEKALTFPSIPPREQGASLGGSHHPAPSSKWEESHGETDGKLRPGESRPEGPCALLICTTKGGDLQTTRSRDG